MADYYFGIKPLGNVNVSHLRTTNLKKFLFGAAYYPEHWNEETRKDDAKRMVNAGMNVVRMAEFAWDIMEREEGRYDFSFYDDIVSKLGKSGISTILCTPTAAPPRWLSKKHPEMLRVDINGVRMEHGTRQHCCHSSPIFRKYSRKITEAMAEHFKNNKNIIAWQTDNEFNCHFAECHCDSCQEGFREFLRIKYNDDIQKLNKTWGNAFWALTYSSFDDIITPFGRPASPNPTHVLEYYRFIDFSVTRFQNEQVEILRKTNKNWFITHNGAFAHINYRGHFTKDLDLFGFDIYPFFEYDPQERSHDHAYSLDRVRSYSGNFIILEHQSGGGGVGDRMHDNPVPGEMRRMTYTSIAHGADSLLYFRWRTCIYGAEEYWCGILDHDNIPKRRYNELVQTGDELKRIGPEIIGTSVHVDAAVAGIDMDVEEGHNIYSLGLPAPRKMGGIVHKWLWQNGYSAGCVHPEDNLDDIKLYIVPHWSLFKPEWAVKIKQFAEKGGTVVIGARTATKDMQNTVVPDTPPGCLAEFAGVTVKEYGRQNIPDKRSFYIRIDNKKVLTDLWYETLQCLKGAVKIAEWEGEHISGETAVSMNKIGKGYVYYVGTYLTADIVNALMPIFIKRSGLTMLDPGTPRGVEAVLRKNTNKKLWFFINNTWEKQTVKKVPQGIDLITNREAGDFITLEAAEVAVIKEKVK